MNFLYKFKTVRTAFTCLARFAVWTTWLAGVSLVLVSSSAIGGERLTLNFNPDWKFIKADPVGAAAPDFDDSGWTNVSAPHTYNDIDTFDDWSLPGHRGEQNQWGGRTWYRKTFNVPESYNGKNIYIEFEGVRQVAEVYLNGKLLGVSKTGFVPFGFDLTPHLRFGAPNILAVMCDNRFMKDPLGKESGTTAGKTNTSKEKKDAGSDLNMAPPPSQSLAQLSAQVNVGIPEDVDIIAPDQIPWNNPHWHPAHGGIYRNVYLHVVDPLHISLPLYSFLETVGPYVYAADVSEKSAKVNLEVPFNNGRKSAENIELRAEVLDHNGKRVLELTDNGQVTPGGSAEFKVSGVIENPQMWEPGYPYLYRVVCSLLSGGETIDTQEIPLGIRTVRWDVKNGFYINVYHLKLHGWGLKPGSVTIQSVPVKIDNGASPELPAMPAVPLPKEHGGDAMGAGTTPQIVSQAQTGRFVKSFSYSGPTTSLHVEQDAQNGKKIYSDSDLRFSKLPAELKGGDYVQASTADKLYSAVDLMEIAVKAGTVISVAYDDRLPRPSWLTSQFKPTELSLTIDGKPMKVFQRLANGEESLTLGANAENADAKACNMYIVFICAAPGSR